MFLFHLFISVQQQQSVAQSRLQDSPPSCMPSEDRFIKIKESSADDFYQQRIFSIEAERVAEQGHSRLALDSSDSDTVRHSPESVYGDSRIARPNSNSSHQNEPDELGLALMRSALLGFASSTPSNHDSSHNNGINEDHKQTETMLNVYQVEDEQKELVDPELFRTVSAFALDSCDVSAESSISMEEPLSSVANDYRMDQFLPIEPDNDQISFAEKHFQPIKATSYENLPKNSSSYNAAYSPFNVAMEEDVPYEEVDLEFEFDDEPEEVQVNDLIFAPLKFAQIRNQETPTHVATDEATNGLPQNENQVDLPQDLLSEDNHIYMNGANSGSMNGTHNRQKYQVMDVLVKKPATSKYYIQNFSPKMLHTSNYMQSNEQGLTPIENIENNETIKPVTQETTLAAPGYGIQTQSQSEVIYTYVRPRFDSSDDPELSYSSVHVAAAGTSDTAAVLRLPDRNLTNDRFNIIDYETRNQSPAPSFKHQQMGLIRPLKRVDSTQADEHEPANDDFRSNFHSLRSIFEHQRQDSPRTEYLSEIIKKNNEEGRKKSRTSGSVSESGRKVPYYQNSQATFNESKVTTNDAPGFADEKIPDEYQASIAESDLSSTSDFDFSSISPRVQVNK